LIFDAHVKNAHAGANWIHSHLRNKGHWLMGSKRKIGSIIKRCIPCQKATGRQMKQKMAQLPAFRSEQSDVWVHCGTDTAGPLYLKTVDGPQRKCYVMIFIDMSTRGVHLELTNGLETEEIVMSIRRLFARRGVIKAMHSDQFKSFLRGKKELETLIITQNQASVIASKLDFEWTFTTERASWHGVLRKGKSEL
jgi:hypothetical protein